MSYVFYSTFREEQQRGAQSIQIEDHPELVQALQLFEEARTFKLGLASLWPKNYPMPSLLAPTDSNIAVANELFLCATSWILHHEIAHKSLEHGIAFKMTSIHEERDADKEATNWILYGPLDKEVLTKRALGIAVAISSLIAFDIHNGSFIDTSHPKSYHRFYNCLYNDDKFDDNHIIYPFTISQLILHTHISKNYPSFNLEKLTPNSNYRDMLSELLVQVNSHSG